MNKVFLVGNLTRDPSFKQTPNGISVATFTVAVRRRMKNPDGTYGADFINCIAWRQGAEFASKYFQKGSGIAVAGRIQTRSYDDKNGNKRYITEVIVEEMDFAGGKSGAKKETENMTADELFGEEIAGFEQIDDANLPF